MSTQVVLIPTGAANIASVRAAFTRLEVASRLAEQPSDIDTADYLVLPGVGSFGAAMQRLRELAYVEPLRERLQQLRPTLAVCVGMQILARASDESPGTAGLGTVDCCIERFAGAARIPQFGWNGVTANGASRLLESGYAYFANSYCMKHAPEGWSVASATYGETYVAAMERGDVLACQFHPELSGTYGATLLQRWLRKEAR